MPSRVSAIPSAFSACSNRRACASSVMRFRITITSVGDFEFDRPLPIVMTEKDAVKCACLGLPEAFMVPIEVELPDGFADLLHKRLRHVQQDRA